MKKNIKRIVSKISTSLHTSGPPPCPSCKKRQTEAFFIFIFLFLTLPTRILHVLVSILSINCYILPHVARICHCRSILLGGENCSDKDWKFDLALCFLLPPPLPTTITAPHKKIFFNSFQQKAANFSRNYLMNQNREGDW